MENKDDKASEAKESTDRHIPTVESDVNKTMQSLRDKLRIANNEITRLKAEFSSVRNTFSEMNKKLMDDIIELKAELERERELRKELVWLAEFGYSVMSVNHPRLAEAKSLIKRAKN